MSNALKIIEALGRHEDEASIDVLKDVGTNSEKEEIREATAQALIRKNSGKSLRILVADKGKGINDLSTRVALSTVNHLLELEDKATLMEVLGETIESTNCEEEIRNTARSLRALITLSE
ncbi:MAG: hypothetical protein MJ180_04505 [Candidatus Gastranaerophilales bacterium]|nr:hypothetical protein [Candidatus Gastranaerophilales bacterium]